MHYVTFSITKTNSEVTYDIGYEGSKKQNAYYKFFDYMTKGCRVHAPARTAYFVGFSEQLAFIQEIKTGSLSVGDKVSKLLVNQHLAAFVHVFKGSGYREKLAEASAYPCDECGKTATVKRNVYGKLLCKGCMAAYRNTRESLAEYVVDLANGTYTLNDLSKADQSAITTAWTNNRDEGTANEQPDTNNRTLLKRSGYTDEELLSIETASGLWKQASAEE
jgi:hypothetical protein